MEAIARLGSKATHFSSLRHECPEGADRLRRTPDCRKQTSRMELGTCESGFGIGLDRDTSDKGTM